MTSRNIGRYKSRQEIHANFRDFSSSQIDNALHTISFGERVTDVLVERNEESDVGIFSFSPAITSPGVTRPYFVGAGVLSELPVHRIYLSDPSLELNDGLALAWFAGNREQPNMSNDMQQIIDLIISKLGIRHTIFVGTSGGGFAALKHSARTPGSLAMVVNPQTDILRYHKQHVAKYAKHAWGMTYDKANDVLGKRIGTQVVGTYSEPLDNTVLWLQNIQDDHHVDIHMRPLLADVHELNRVFVHLGHDWGPGHQPAPKETQIRLLESIVKCRGNWSLVWKDDPNFEKSATVLERYAN